MWSPGNKGAYPRRISAKARGSSIQENNSMHEASMSDEDITSIKVHTSGSIYAEEQKGLMVLARIFWTQWFLLTSYWIGENIVS
ncbi:uncharacterized protein LOC111277716 isoform X2 [Durio zibethinus]|uniref:Uncharacterized protein LOC111277716 isoform X2 n=1 Tax=Durio zibethinus TaxID=66656 RepID=A0A6P5WWI8_DURZI|nr:uncharacterized protein LOC111277716 isoform X2 [Durio zibethinus]